MDNQIIFEGISYNVPDILQEVKNGLTEKKFIQRGINEGKYREFSMEDRKKLLKEAFALIIAKS